LRASRAGSVCPTTPICRTGNTRSPTANSTGFDPRWDRTLAIIDENFELHAYSVWYWSSLENDDPEEQWLVTPFLRRILAKHRHRLENP